LPTLELLGKIVEVNGNSGIFVTMNPAGKGYGGRSKLPDNLKQLFRPVAMHPDFELIAEILLFSEQLKTAKSLAQKSVSIFLLAKQLLTLWLGFKSLEDDFDGSWRADIRGKSSR